MKRLLLTALLALSTTACASDKKLELACFKPSPNGSVVTVWYKNADDIYYNQRTGFWNIIYLDTKDFAGGIVFYKQELRESCSIVNKEK